MNNALTPKPVAGFVEPDDATLTAMSDDELMDILRDVLGVTVRVLRLGARAWAELERRGRDLSQMRMGLLEYLPAIAAGVVVPEVVVHFIKKKNTSILRTVTKLLPADQKRLADGEPVLVVERTPGGEFTHRMIPAHVLTQRQVNLAFDVDAPGIRTEREQVVILSEPSKAVCPPKRGRFRADPNKGVLLYNGRPVEVADVLHALADLKGVGDGNPGPDAVVISFRVSPAEKKAIGAKAAAGETTVTTLVRDACRCLGLFAERAYQEPPP